MRNRLVTWGWICLGTAVALLVVMAILWGTGVLDGREGGCDGDCGDPRLIIPEVGAPSTLDPEAPGSGDCCGSPSLPGVVPGEQVPDSGVPPVESTMTEQMERNFLEQMIPHHEDAVAMSRLALTKAGHPELATLAQAIIDSQTGEIDQMRAWYKAWYGTDVPAADAVIPGSGTGGGMMGGGMMGGGMMGGGTDLQALESSADFDREFIEQMIPHHQMGVMMASMIAGTARPELTALAEAMVTVQTAEIEQMRDWYQTWYR